MALSDAVKGFSLSCWGFVLAMQARAVLNCYLTFAARLLTIAIVSYVVLSASYVTLACLLVFAISGGPFFPIVLFSIGPLCVVAIAILLYFGFLPLSTFFAVSGGILKPFLSLPSISYTLATIFNPLSADQFFLIGIDIFSLRSNRDNYRSIVQKNRPHWTRGIYIAMSQFAFEIALHAAVRALLLVLPSVVSSLAWILVGAFLFSSKLITIWTMRANRLTFLDHAAVCFSNTALFIGFGLPFELLRLFIDESGLRLRFIWLIVDLGLLITITASLIDKVPVSKPLPP